MGCDGRGRARQSEAGRCARPLQHRQEGLGGQRLPLAAGGDAGLFRGEKSVEEDYEEAAGRNAYRFTSAYYGCILEAGGAFKGLSISILRAWLRSIASRSAGVVEPYISSSPRDVNKR